MPRDAVVLAFGDSLTFGTGAAPADSYPAVLSRLTGLKVINAGVPGEVTADGLKRLPGLLRAHSPALLILCHGGNDLLRGTNDRRIAENLSAMVALAQEAHAEVLLLAVPRPRILLRPPKFYAQVADEHGVPRDVETLPRIIGKPAWMADEVHPNARGYEELARAVAGRIRIGRQP
jgi:lysophospholipase L1-like esterase